jgi:AcrR family transcriptional regulator
VARPRTHDAALRERLLDRAGELLSAEGPRALSLRRLAADVRTSTTAVYSLFGGKAELLRALHQEAMHRFAARLAHLEPTADPVADLLRIGALYRESALADPHLYAVMFSRAAREPADTRGEAFAVLLDAVRRALAAGQFRGGSAEQIALACWGAVHGLVSLELYGKLPPDLDVADDYQRATRAVLDGWRSG